jgi:chemotaxis protein methyltransferase CheR
MPVLTEDIKGRVKNIISERTGLYFKDYALKDLESAIERRMKDNELDSGLSYLNLLSFSERKEDEFRELLNILTINHTYFFRNEPQFELLKTKILPEIITRKTAGSYIVSYIAHREAVGWQRCTKYERRCTN